MRTTTAGPSRAQSSASSESVEASRRAYYERISQRDRMLACERQAREAKLSTAKRHEFVRDCIKGDTAAAGSGAKK